MILLAFLLALIQPQQPVKENVKVEFEFTSMKLGKPTLAFYYYNVSLTNNSNKAVYVVLPRWFGEKIPETGNVWGAQYDSFDQVLGSTLFANSSFTIIMLKAKEKVTLKDYDIESFDDAVRNNSTISIPYLICNDITVGSYSLREFMEKTALFGDNLEYKIKDPISKEISIQVIK